MVVFGLYPRLFFLTLSLAKHINRLQSIAEKGNKKGTMAKATLTRRQKQGTICLRINNGPGDHAIYSLPVKVSAKEWDGQQVTPAHPRRQELNLYLSGILTRAQVELMRIQEKQPTRHLKASELKNLVVAAIFTEEAQKPAGFLDIYRKFMYTHENARTRDIYSITLDRIHEYDPRELTFEDLTVDWLDGFDRHLRKQSPSKNARAIHFRNIRAVFNYAIDIEATTLYPFRRWAIKYEETAHRDLTSADIRRLFAYQPPTVHANKHASKPLDYAVKYLDLARLTFYLIGINVIDLWNLRPEDIYGGRLHYRRAKTGRLYDIKLEPEALDIIDRYKGTQKLLAPCEKQANYKDFAKAFNHALAVISKAQRLPRITTYWLRHSWATIAYSEAQIPIDTISDCLGHKNGQKVTLGYVDKLRAAALRDAANRSVLDLVTLA